MDLCNWDDNRTCSGCGYVLPVGLPLSTRRNCKPLPTLSPPDVPPPSPPVTISPDQHRHEARQKALMMARNRKPCGGCGGKSHTAKQS